MNRAERRTAGKGQDDQRVVLTALVAHFESGQTANLDVSKLQVIDRHTGRPLFSEVFEPIASEIIEADPPIQPHQEFKDDSTQSYTVRFDTPEGPMEYVKNGEWSGVKKVL